MFSSIQNTNEIMCVQLVAVGARSAPAWIPGLGCSEEGNYPAVPPLGCAAAPGKRPLALPPLEPCSLPMLVADWFPLEQTT